MKLSVLSIVAVLSIISPTYGSNGIHLQKRFLTCDNILAVKICDKFRRVGNTIQGNANAVETLIKDAYTKGITKAEDIKKYIEQELEAKILSKSCEELTGKTFCDKLEAIGVYMKKKRNDLKPYLVKAIMAGNDKVDEIVNKVEEYIKNDLMKKTCVDILTVDQCKRIDDIGDALTLKKDAIKQALVDSVMSGYHKTIDTVTKTFTNMKKAAENFLCEDLLNPDVCISLRDYAKRLRIGMPKMMSAVRSVIVMGYKGSKGFLTIVFKITDAFIDCEHFISHQNCEKIKKTADKIGAKVTEINKAIREAVTKGITEAEKIYTTTLNFLKNKFGRKRRSLIETYNLKAQLQKYKEMLTKHVATADKYIKEVIKGLLEKYEDVDESIKQVVTDAITSGKVQYEQVKAYIQKLIEKHNSGIKISKRELSIRDLLAKALKKSTGLTKVLIKTLMGYTTEKLHKLKRYVQKIIDSVGGVSKRDVDSQLLDETEDSLLNNKFNEIEENLKNDVDNMVADIADETDQLIADVITSETNIQKRSLDINLKDFNLAQYITDVLKIKLNKLHMKVKETSAQLLREVKEALVKAGVNMTEVSKVVLQKVNEMIEKLKLES